MTNIIKIDIIGRSYYNMFDEKENGYWTVPTDWFVNGKLNKTVYGINGNFDKDKKASIKRAFIGEETDRWVKANPTYTTEEFCKAVTNIIQKYSA